MGAHPVVRHSCIARCAVRYEACYAVLLHSSSKAETNGGSLPPSNAGVVWYMLILLTFPLRCSSVVATPPFVQTALLSACAAGFIFGCAAGWALGLTAVRVVVNGLSSFSFRSSA